MVSENSLVKRLTESACEKVVFELPINNKKIERYNRIANEWD